jgi:hypothetical protein
LPIQVKVLARLDEGVDELILAADRSNAGSGEVNIAGVGGHGAIAMSTAAGGGLIGSKCHLHAGHVVAGGRGSSGWQHVLEMNDELVAGIHAQGERFKAGAGEVAVSGEALPVDNGDQLPGEYEHVVLAF